MTREGWLGRTTESTKLTQQRTTIYKRSPSPNAAVKRMQPEPVPPHSPHLMRWVQLRVYQLYPAQMSQLKKPANTQSNHLRLLPGRERLPSNQGRVKQVPTKFKNYTEPTTPDRIFKLALRDNCLHLLFVFFASPTPSLYVRPSLILCFSLFLFVFLLFFF